MLMDETKNIQNYLKVSHCFLFILCYRNDDISQQKLIKMEHCDCHRWIETRSNLEVNARDELTHRAIKYNETTCGRDAFARGSRQKVVAFSFYGDVNTQLSIKKGYFEGIEGNLNIMPQYYPGRVNF